MAIKTRTQSPAPRIHRHERPVRLPPTQSQLSAAAYRLADALGARDLDQATRDAAAANMYAFAAKSVASAWSLVEAAVVAVRCYQGRRKISGAHHEVVGPFRGSLEQAKADDLATKGKLLEELKSADDDRKVAIEAELKELLLRGIPQGKSWELGEKAGAFLVDAMRREFMPVKGSPLAVEDFPKFVEGNVQFLDWLGVSLLFTEEQNADYASAKEWDKAARAQDAASPAPEAEEVEEEAPAAQSA